MCTPQTKEFAVFSEYATPYFKKKSGMKKLLNFLFLVSTTCLLAQNNTELEHYSFEELEKVQQQQARPYVIFIHTDWCRFCHGMRKNTFSHPDIVSILNTDYYFVEINAEQKKDITFLDTTFSYRPSGANTGIHDLAKALGTVNGKISYPTTVFLNTKNEIILQYAGFADHKTLYELLEKIKN